MRGSKVAGWWVSFFTSVLMAVVFAAVVVSLAGESFAGEPEVSSDAKVKKGGTSGLQVSLLYPANGVLQSNQSQMVQVGVTVTPKPGTSLGSYRLQMKMRAPSGHRSEPRRHRLIWTPSAGVKPSDDGSGAALVMELARLRQPPCEDRTADIPSRSGWV